MKKNAGIYILIFTFLVDVLVNAIWGWSAAKDQQYPWFDTSLHFLGGLGVCLFLRQHFTKNLANLSNFVRILFLLGVTVLIGVLWEFAEYLGSQIVHYYGGAMRLGGDLADTLLDFVMDILGGLVGAIIPRSRAKKAPK